MTMGVISQFSNANNILIDYRTLFFLLRMLSPYVNISPGPAALTKSARLKCILCPQVFPCHWKLLSKTLSRKLHHINNRTHCPSPFPWRVHHTSPCVSCCTSSLKRERPCKPCARNLAMAAVIENRPMPSDKSESPSIQQNRGTSIRASEHPNRTGKTKIYIKSQRCRL